jgi:hypothetical protein
MSLPDATILAAIITAGIALIAAVFAGIYSGVTTKRRAQEAAKDELAKTQKEMDTKITIANREIDTRLAVADRDIDTKVRLAQHDIETKLEELRQSQIGEIIRKRVECYPDLWALCLEKITRPMFAEHGTQITDGWAAALSDSLEDWHSKHGAFLSQESYIALHRLRKRCRIFAEHANTAAEAKEPFKKQIPPYYPQARPVGPLEELEDICTRSFTDENDHKQYYGLYTSLKNDLGSYVQAAFSL